MEQAHAGPKILILRIVQFPSIPPHHPFHGEAVLNVEGVFVVLPEKVPGLFSG
jgi:hypothetical protein